MSKEPASRSDGLLPGKLGSLKIVPVEPGHEHEPGELEANIDLRTGTVYVRAADWPKFRDELNNLPTRQ